ncbi:MAG: hypothetical protein PF448_06345 [Bacteroidales bacterium]|jgi:hypothetical protein|nr:hypothetical protein [Bacteroidales bacterium]
MFDFIKQRIESKGFDVEKCQIEPVSIKMPLVPVEKIIEADNELWFLHDVSNYEKAFTIIDDNTVYKNDDYIIDKAVPFGIVELTGNIRIVTNDTDPLTLLFYKVVPGPQKTQNNE